MAKELNEMIKNQTFFLACALIFISCENLIIEKDGGDNFTLEVVPLKTTLNDLNHLLTSFPIEYSSDSIKCKFRLIPDDLSQVKYEFRDKENVDIVSLTEKEKRSGAIVNASTFTKRMNKEEIQSSFESLDYPRLYEYQMPQEEDWLFILIGNKLDQLQDKTIVVSEISGLRKALISEICKPDNSSKGITGVRIYLNTGIATVGSHQLEMITKTIEMEGILKNISNINIDPSQRLQEVERALIFFTTNADVILIGTHGTRISEPLAIRDYLTQLAVNKSIEELQIDTLLSNDDGKIWEMRVREVIYHVR